MEETILSDNISNNINNNDINNNDTNKYIDMNLDCIMNILSQKINNTKIINESLIEEICIGIKSYCQNHNFMINNWFDDQYNDNLSMLKKNNEDYLKSLNIYKLSSFVFVENKY